MPVHVLPILCIVAPAGLVLMKDRGWAFVRRVNPIIFSYLLGILLANSGLLGDDALPVLDLTASVAVGLAIPLALFSVNWTRMKDLGRPAALAMGLAGAAAVLVSLAALPIARHHVNDAWKMSGLLVGIYTGGTPNLAALRQALAVPSETYLAVHTSDMFTGALYVLFLMTAAGRVMRPLLPGRRLAVPARPEDHPSRTHADEVFRDLFLPPRLKGTLAAVGLAFLVFAVSASLTIVVPGEGGGAVVILALTTLSLLLAVHPRVRRLKGTYTLGQFAIYVFCVAVGAMGNLNRILGAAPSILAYVAVVLLGSFLLHALLCRVAGIDADTMLIASTAAVCSPPFVGITAGALDREDLIAPGMAAGLLGYAAGNYLGVLTARLGSLLFP